MVCCVVHNKFSYARLRLNGCGGVAVLEGCVLEGFKE